MRRFKTFSYAARSCSEERRVIARVEDVFEGGDFSDGTHFLGPALYAEFDAGRRRMIAPRFGIFAGLGRNSPDAVASLNIELKF